MPGSTNKRNKKLRHNKTKRSSNKKVFKKKDFYSGDGFMTSIWGPPQWHMLHTISFNYPIEPTLKERIKYRNYILSLQNVLPCKFCRKNLHTNLKQLPLTMADMKNRDTFSRYIYELHELVNKMLHKQSNLTYCAVRERYEHFRSRCTTEAPTIFKFSKLKRTKKREQGCTEPLYGKKARCILNIVPQDNKGQSIQIHNKCIKRR